MLVTRIIAETMNISDEVTQQAVAISRCWTSRASMKTQTLAARSIEPSSRAFMVHQFLLIRVRRAMSYSQNAGLIQFCHRFTDLNIKLLVQLRPIALILLYDGEAIA